MIYRDRVILIFAIYLGIWAIIVGFGRFFVPERWQNVVLCAGSLVALTLCASSMPLVALLVFILFFIALCAFAMRRQGGVLSGLLAAVGILFSHSAFHADLTLSQRLWIAALYLAMGLGLGYYAEAAYVRRGKSLAGQNRLLWHVKELGIVRDIGVALQGTLQLEKILHIVLTAITAGYGLGFNRAMLFFISEDKSSLKGAFGIGPLNTEEGFGIWEDVVERRMHLRDFIDSHSTMILENITLTDMVQSMSVQLHESGLLQSAFTKVRSVIVQDGNAQDALARVLRERFAIGDFGIIPLVASQEAMGVIIVDNSVNHAPIVPEKLDNALMLATQAAMAIRNANAYRIMERLAITDGLTGVYNRRYLHEKVAEVWENTALQGPGMAILMIDVDHFKHYNDTQGHLAGDTVLSTIAHVLTDLCSGQGLVFRYGGEEFLILFTELEADEVSDSAERIRATIAAYPFAQREEQPNRCVSVSIGVALRRNTHHSFDDLARDADQALYDAKRSGRNRVTVW